MLIRGAFVLITALLCVALPASPALADYKQSRLWFESLPEMERNQIQSGLILVGLYDGLVDGEFGPNTNTAILAFERIAESIPNGILDQEEQRLLAEQSEKVFDLLGFEFLRDQSANIGVLIPSLLLTRKSQTRRGNLYASQNGDVELETVLLPGSVKGFEELYASLSRAGSSRSIAYSILLERAFVVSGVLDQKNFYTVFFDEGYESVGFSISWSDEYDEIGRLVSVYIASNSAPLSRLPEVKEAPVTKQEETEQPPSTPQEGVQYFGVFVTFDEMPEIIGLRGPIGINSPLDFRRALRASPQANTLVLNSDGGLVSSALIIAQDVFERRMSTQIFSEHRCYSACSFIFFAGDEREVAGELGVHQISSDSSDLNSAQQSLSDILDILDEFGVEQAVISLMLRTPPDQMYVFSKSELIGLSINRPRRESIQ